MQSVWLYVSNLSAMVYHHIGLKYIYEKLRPEDYDVDRLSALMSSFLLVGHQVTLRTSKYHKWQAKFVMFEWDGALFFV